MRANALFLSLCHVIHKSHFYNPFQPPAFQIMLKLLRRKSQIFRKKSGEKSNNADLNLLRKRPQPDLQDRHVLDPIIEESILEPTESIHRTYLRRDVSNNTSESYPIPPSPPRTTDVVATEVAHPPFRWGTLRRRPVERTQGSLATVQNESWPTQDADLRASNDRQENADADLALYDAIFSPLDSGRRSKRLTSDQSLAAFRGRSSGSCRRAIQ